MSNKQALREFQARLAQRLQAASSSGTVASWLAVEAGPHKLLLPLTHAGEIFSWTDVQGVPYVRPWFLGVVNLRGGLFGLMDVVSFLDGSAHHRPRSEMDLNHCRLVTFNPLLETNCALLVDRLVGLRTADDFASSHKATDEGRPYFGHVYVGTDGQQWQEINLQALSQHQAFLGIGA